MKGNIRIVFFLCIGLLICVLIGQGGWLYKTRKMEINRFRQEAGDRLGDSFKEFLDEEWMTRKVPFSYGLKEDKRHLFMGIAVGLEKLLYLLLISFGKWAELFFTIIYMSNIILMFFNWTLYIERIWKRQV